MLFSCCFREASVYLCRERCREETAEPRLYVHGDAGQQDTGERDEETAEKV